MPYLFHHHNWIFYILILNFFILLIMSSKLSKSAFSLNSRLFLLESVQDLVQKWNFKCMRGSRVTFLSSNELISCNHSFFRFCIYFDFFALIFVVFSIIFCCSFLRYLSSIHGFLYFFIKRLCPLLLFPINSIFTRMWDT